MMASQFSDRTGARIAVYATYLLTYVVLDWVSYIYPVLPLAITPWNPPPGLSLALLLFFGIRSWPAVFTAVFLAEVLVREIPAHPFILLLSSGVVTAGYVAIAAALRARGLDLALARPRDLFLLIAIAVPGTLLIAILYVGLYAITGLVWKEELLSSTLRFWVGDMIGVIVTVPLLLIHGPLVAKPGWLRFSREALLQGFTIALTLWVIFGIEYTDEFKFFYLIFIPLVWIAVRSGIQGATLALVAIQLGLIAALHWGGHAASTVVDFQFLMLSLTITGLFLGMTVTEQRRAQESLTLRETELHHAQRLIGAGEMASAMAHELNQPLAAIANYARACQLMLEMPEEHRRLAETMNKMIGETARAASVVDRLREFFRAGALRLERMETQVLISAAVELVAKRAAREGVALRIDAAPDLPLLQIDRVHLETALHNLLVNAIEAAATTGGTPRVTITARRRDDGWLGIRVCDTGPGIAEEVASRLFQPLATSKSDGMGLGLAISRTLVEANGGRLDLLAQGGPGACFELILPPSEAE